jgi:hypothetical protein
MRRTATTESSNSAPASHVCKKYSAAIISRANTTSMINAIIFMISRVA